LKKGLAVSGRDHAGQLALGFAEIGAQSEVYEYGVLVTSLEEEVLTLAQHYRDRADRARFSALYNWWSLFVRLAEPDRHLEAVTSRPLLLSASPRPPGMPARPR
jgi:hypothetical protein